MPIIRVSILRCKPDQFAEFKEMMAESNAVLEPGIRRMRGIIHYYAGADHAASSLTNVSIWQTLADAQQLDTFQPMLDLGKVFVAKGATFERPITNYASLWEIVPRALQSSATTKSSILNRDEVNHSIATTASDSTES